MRRAARKDANHQAIVGALRTCGVAVLDLSRVGGGCPDLLVASGKRSVLVEVKDGSKPPSERKLRTSQQEFAQRWPLSIEVVETIDEAIALARRLREVE